MLFGHNKISILDGVTPLHLLPAMSDKLGIELYIKRDDLTPLGGGGNKLRKLEYLLCDAKQKGATLLLTLGGVQTNHGRLTAAAAAKYGMKCVIACIGEYPGELGANLLLDRLMGADVVIKHSDGRSEDIQNAELSAQLKAEYEALGETVYEIPVGGSNIVGMLGYYECAMEIDAQARAMGIGDARVVSGVGSMGTYLGLCCGFKENHSGLRLTGIAISPFGETKEKRLAAYFAEAKSAFGLRMSIDECEFDIEKDYVRGGYNLPSEHVRKAIADMARTEAILLDPCYTGKAFAGLCDMAAEGKLRKGEKVIFLHTGGMYGLYTPHHRVEFEKELMDGVRII